MTIQELKYFVAVAEHLHFGRAAAACHVSQPTLSAGLRSLEAKLDQQLFERGPHGVLAVAAAAPLLEQARRVLAEARQLEQMARASGHALSRLFRLGAIPTVGPYLLPRVIPGLRRDWPELRLHLVEAKTDELLRQLRRGDLDAVLLSPPVNERGLSCEKLYREDFLLALPDGHRLGAKKALNLNDLAEEQLLLLDEGHCLRDQVVDYCRIGAASARELTRSSSLETLRSMVTAGVGCTLLPALAINREQPFEVRRLTKPQPARDVNCYWRRGFAGHDAALMLARGIRDYLPANVSAIA